MIREDVIHHYLVSQWFQDTISHWPIQSHNDTRLRHCTADCGDVNKWHSYGKRRFAPAIIKSHQVTRPADVYHISRDSRNASHPSHRT